MMNIKNNMPVPFYNKTLIIAAFSCVSLLPVTAGNAMPVATCDDSLIVVTPLTGTLDFATTSACGSAATITVDEDTGVRTVTGCSTFNVGASQTESFRVDSGQTSPAPARKTVRVTIDTITTNVTSGGDSMPVDTFRLFPCNCTTTTQPGNKTEDYTVGASASMGASQTPGTYTGTFSITAECD